ncbi:MAG: hypothetical protein KIH00_10695 [Lachnospiraceae bacterium]|nr:hypothetical protein [Lachnospiraceae bacterium]
MYNFWELEIDKWDNLHYDYNVLARTKTSSMDYRFQRAGMVRSRQNEFI